MDCRVLRAFGAGAEGAETAGAAGAAAEFTGITWTVFTMDWGSASGLVVVAGNEKGARARAAASRDASSVVKWGSMAVAEMREWLLALELQAMGP